MVYVADETIASTQYKEHVGFDGLRMLDGVRTTLLLSQSLMISFVLGSESRRSSRLGTARWFYRVSVEGNNTDSEKLVATPSDVVCVRYMV